MTQCHDSTPNPADAGCNSDNAQYSSTPARNASRSDAGGPSLRSPGFEDDDDDEDENENEAPLSAARFHDEDDFRRLFRIEPASIPISVHIKGDKPRPGNEVVDLASRVKP